MSLDIFWFLPTSGDTRYLGTSDFGRPATNEYMRQIAVTAESLGYDGLLIPTGSSCLDPWVTAASLAISFNSPACKLFEFKPLRNPMQHDLVTKPFEHVEGWVYPPTGPGLGVTLDMAAVERFTLRRSVLN